MKNVKLPILGLSLVLLVASCKKDDFKSEAASETSVSNVAIRSNTDTVGWTSPNQWETTDQETFSVRFVSIEDKALTADVADNGLVLLFKKSGAAINALPFEESAAASEEEDETESTNANYWYHQITEGSLLISCDVYNKTATTDANSFKYFIITPQKLQSLQTDGYTTDDLMNLSYSEASSLLKTVN